MQLNFNRFFSNIDIQKFMKLNLLNEHTWLAGGALRAALRGDDDEIVDYDMFFRSLLDAAKVEVELEALGAETIFKCPEGKLTTMKYKDMKIQLITEFFYATMSDCINSFDINASRFITDGTIEGDVMFVGGAWSIDNPDAPPGWYKRTENVDWWADEECSDEEFVKILEDYKNAKPRVMITHDCPHDIAGEMFWNTGLLKGPRYSTRTGNMFQKMFEIHQPEFHFFGHWHITMRYRSGNTTFVCLSELDHIDVDLDDSDHIHGAIAKKFS